MAARWKRRDQLACLGRRGPEGGDSDCPGKGGYPLPHWGVGSPLLSHAIRVPAVVVARECHVEWRKESHKCRYAACSALAPLSSRNLTSRLRDRCVSLLPLVHGSLEATTTKNLIVRRNAHSLVVWMSTCSKYVKPTMRCLPYQHAATRVSENVNRNIL